MWIKTGTEESRKENEIQRYEVTRAKRKGNKAMWKKIGWGMEGDFSDSRKRMYSMAKFIGAR